MVEGSVVQMDGGENVVGGQIYSFRVNPIWRLGVKGEGGENSNEKPRLHQH